MYTSIPHDLLKSRMNNIRNNAFKHKNLAAQTSTSKLAEIKHDPLNGDNKYIVNDICQMTEFLVDNKYVRFGGHLFQLTVGILMETNCA